MLLQLDESTTVCPASLPKDKTCTAAATVKLSGPLATYGTADPLDNIQLVFKDQQSASFELKTDDVDTSNYKLTAKLSVGLDFEQAFHKAARAYVTKDGDLPTQTDILRGASRVLRQLNERIIQ
jgi:hypothetical protein